MSSRRSIGDARPSPSKAARFGMSNLEGPRSCTHCLRNLHASCELWLCRWKARGRLLNWICKALRKVAMAWGSLKKSPVWTMPEMWALMSDISQVFTAEEWSLCAMHTAVTCNQSFCFLPMMDSHLMLAGASSTSESLTLCLQHSKPSVLPAGQQLRSNDSMFSALHFSATRRAGGILSMSKRNFVDGC